MKYKYNCKDCEFGSDSVSEFCDHLRVCPKNPLPVPTAIIERQAEELKESVENA